MSKIVTLNSLDRHHQILEIDSSKKLQRKIWQDDRAGAQIIRFLKELDLTANDSLRVVSGPGDFTSVRVAALAANAVAYLTGVRLFTKRKDARQWRKVNLVAPFYAIPAFIKTKPKC